VSFAAITLYIASQRVFIVVSVADNHSAGQKIPAFMEPKGSLPCSQEPTTDPYLEPDASSPHLPTLFS
jgi:hypothetical protein